jgi:hypothetical protein
MNDMYHSQCYDERKIKLKKNSMSRVGLALLENRCDFTLPRGMNS